MRASASTNDLMESLDRALDKLVAQMSKINHGSKEVMRERRRSKRSQKHEFMKNAGFVGDSKKVA